MEILGKLRNALAAWSGGQPRALALDPSDVPHFCQAAKKFQEAFKDLRPPISFSILIDCESQVLSYTISEARIVFCVWRTPTKEDDSTDKNCVLY